MAGTKLTKRPLPGGFVVQLVDRRLVLALTAMDPYGLPSHVLSEMPDDVSSVAEVTGGEMALATR